MVRHKHRCVNSTKSSKKNKVPDKKTRLMNISFMVDRHIFKNKPIRKYTAKKYLKNVTAIIQESENDPEVFQVCEKLQRQMRAIIIEEQNCFEADVQGVQENDILHSTNNTNVAAMIEQFTLVDINAVDKTNDTCCLETELYSENHRDFDDELLVVKKTPEPEQNNILFKDRQDFDDEIVIVNDLEKEEIFGININNPIRNGTMPGSRPFECYEADASMQSKSVFVVSSDQVRKVYCAKSNNAKLSAQLLNYKKMQELNTNIEIDKTKESYRPKQTNLIPSTISQYQEDCSQSILINYNSQMYPNSVQISKNCIGNPTNLQVVSTFSSAQKTGNLQKNNKTEGQGLNFNTVNESIDLTPGGCRKILFDVNTIPGTDTQNSTHTADFYNYNNKPSIHTTMQKESLIHQKTCSNRPYNEQNLNYSQDNTINKYHTNHYIPNNLIPTIHNKALLSNKRPFDASAYHIKITETKCLPTTDNLETKESQTKINLQQVSNTQKDFIKLQNKSLDQRVVAQFNTQRQFKKGILKVKSDNIALELTNKSKRKPRKSNKKNTLNLKPNNDFTTGRPMEANLIKNKQSFSTKRTDKWIQNIKLIREVDSNEYYTNNIPDSFWNDDTWPPDWNDLD